MEITSTNRRQYWKYLVAVKEKESDYPKYCGICVDFDEIQNEISTQIEHKQYPEGFETKKEAKIIFKGIKKEVKKLLNLRLYDKAEHTSAEDMDFALQYSSVCSEASFYIPGYGVVYVSIIWI